MAHFKRKGPKSTRAGCLMCKNYKDQKVKDTGSARTAFQVRADDRMASMMEEVGLPEVPDDPSDADDE